MTTQDRIETALRASLAERAEDVEVTPALYHRVQRQAARATAWRRGLAVAGGVAAVLAAVAVLPTVVGPTAPDIVDTPPDALPDAVPPGDAAPDEPAPFPELGLSPVQQFELAAAGTAYAVATDGGSTVAIGARAVTLDGTVVTLTSTSGAAAAPLLAAALDDGRIAVIAQDGAGPDPELLVEAAPNRGGVAFAPGEVPALAWIEGTELHVLPLDLSLGQVPTEEFVRVLPLEGDVPSDLRLEQWFYGADAQLILATGAEGGVWSIPMDDSSVFDSAPTDPAFVIDAARDADDAVLLSDLRLAHVATEAGTGVRLTVGEESTVVSGAIGAADRLELSPAVGQRFVLRDPDSGAGLLWSVDVGDDTGGPLVIWDEPLLLAVTPTPGAVASADDLAQPFVGIGSGRDDLTRGSLRFGVEDDGRIVSFGGNKPDPGAAPFTADTGVGVLAAAHVGAVVTDGVVDLAVESIGPDGDHALHLVSYVNGGNSSTGPETFPATADVVGAAIELPGPLTGATWARGAGERSLVVWSTEDAWGVVEATPQGLAEVSRDLRTTPLPGPVVDAVTVVFEQSSSGTGIDLSVTFGTVGGGTHRTGEAYAADGTVTRSELTQLEPEALVVRLGGDSGAVALMARLSADTGLLEWSAGEETGTLPLPQRFLTADADQRRVVVGSGRLLLAVGDRTWTVRFEPPIGGGPDPTLTEDGGSLTLVALD